MGNCFENGFWTYSLDLIHKGLKGCFKSLKEDVLEKYGVAIDKIGGMGISGMMHGYLAFDKEDNLLVPFRTWRNTTTGEAAEELTQLFNFNVPQRWSISHLYQAILNNESHVKNIHRLNTLAGYIHYRLTGEWAVGIGEASGIFPISGNDCDKVMLDKFSKLMRDMGVDIDIYSVLPKVKTAGESGAVVTIEGADFLDESGKFKPGVPVCPPEGDAGTGMVAYNYLAAEPVAGVDKGTPMYFHGMDTKMSLGNFFKAQLYATVAVLKIGMNILTGKENVASDGFNAHGGLFKVEGVAQKILANALKTPVTVSNTAGEGGAWGMALLAAFMIKNDGMSLSDWLDEKVFWDLKNILKTISGELKHKNYYKYDNRAVAKYCNSPQSVDKI